MTAARFVSCLAFFLFAASAGGAERFALDNGLTVILEENHKEKKVAVEAIYRAGFMQEPKGKPHISHIVEHMVCYCPTASFGPREAFMLLQQRGMTNAETLSTFVHYDYLVPAADLELALKIESERLTSIRFDENILKQEARNAVAEIDVVQQNPQAGLLKFGMIGLGQVLRFQAAFVPVYAGAAELTVDDVRQFHKDHYRTDEGVLAIVGDFDSGVAKDLVRRHFGQIPKPPPRQKTRIELGKTVAVKWDLGSDAVYLICPSNPDDANASITLTLFGNYLNGQIQQDAQLQKLTKIRFCSNQIYPVGEMPFFVFAETKQGAAIQTVRDALKQAVDATVENFNGVILMQMRMGLAYFVRSSALQGGYLPPNVPFERILVQEALNRGIKEVLENGLSEEDFLARLNAIDYETARQIIRSHVLGDSRREIVFLSTAH